ncbi:MAG: NYN domain-containing protein [Methyloligellaceae bacterium]
MDFYPQERIVLLIDGANLFATARALQTDIDFKRLLKVFKQQGNFVRALYFTAVADDQEYSSIRPLIDWLDYNGFSMYTKPTREYKDEEGRRKLKSSIQVELAVKAMELSDTVDHVVLFSGDGDFCALVEALQNRGNRVSVVSSLVPSPPFVADELRRQADQFLELNDLLGDISLDEDDDVDLELASKKKNDNNDYENADH